MKFYGYYTGSNAAASRLPDPTPLPLAVSYYIINTRRIVSNTRQRAPTKGTQTLTKKWLAHRRILFLAR